MLRRKRLIAVGLLIAIIPVAAIAWWLLSPLFISKSVDEAFPFSATAAVPEDMTRDAVEQVLAGMAKVDQPVEEKMPEPAAGPSSNQLSPAMAEALSAAIPPSVQDNLAGAVMKSMPQDLPAATKEAMAKSVAEAVKDAIPGVLQQALTQAMPKETKGGDAAQATPVKLKTGGFAGADRFHSGSGQATIYRLPDGSQVLRLEDFKVTNGPDLRVILTPAKNPEGAGDVTVPGHVELGKLKGNLGNQNYPVPGDVDVATFHSVVIFCKPFRVVFSVAPLAEAG